MTAQVSINSRIEEREATEDLYFGQVVIITARYFLIASLVVVMLSLDSSLQLATATVPVVVFLAMNFFLHARYLMGQPANMALIGVTSAIDIALVTTLVVVGPGGARGMESPLFVLYYPLILAFGFVVPRRLEVPYTALAIVLYGAAVLLLDPDTLTSVTDSKLLVLRLMTFAACGGIANYYWRVLRARRREALAAGAV